MAEKASKIGEAATKLEELDQDWEDVEEQQLDEETPQELIFRRPIRIARRVTGAVRTGRRIARGVKAIRGL
jgi:hypothetical protein